MKLGFRELSFVQLLATLILVLLLIPFFLNRWFLAAAIQFLLLNGLIVSLAAAGNPPRVRWPIFTCFLAGVLFSFLSFQSRDPETNVIFWMAGLGTGMVVMAACIWGLLTHVLKNRRVTVDVISAAVLVYFFVAISFSYVYSAMVLMNPSSFHFPDWSDRSNPQSITLQMLYLSFVTIATLGFGEILPTTPQSQFLVAMEAILGQFYIALIISWLVGMFISHATHRKTQD